MPIFRIKEKIVYFCHVPKCGGTSVEEYLENRFGALSFLDRRWESIPLKNRWSNTSPQHIEISSLYRVFDASFFDVDFCMVRNPGQRFISAFKHARQKGTIPQWLDVYGLLSRIENADDAFHRSTDNHFRHASDFLSSGARIFKIENGGKDLIEWLDELAGQRGKLRKLPVRNQAHEIPKVELTTFLSRFSAAVLPSKPIQTNIDSKLANRIFDVYRQDFGRFRYASPNQQPLK